MGIFGKKEGAKKEAIVVKPVKAQKSATLGTLDLTSVIKKPRITEKVALLSENNVYTFEVRKNATKYDVRDAIKTLYKVTPIRVNIVNKQPRHTMSRARGRDVMEHGLRKAYVYLKKGDRIELV